VSFSRAMSAPALAVTLTLVASRARLRSVTLRVTVRVPPGRIAPSAFFAGLA
jgi:hypothetical protein